MPLLVIAPGLFVTNPPPQVFSPDPLAHARAWIER
jgi:hypothetical protein